MAGIERNPTTAESLVAELTTHSSTLNLDTHQERPMPSIIPGKGCVPPFIKALRESRFINLAIAIAVAHGGEWRIRHGKNFLNKAQAGRFQACMPIVADFFSITSKNASMLNTAAKVGSINEYRGGAGTTIGQIVLSFYEMYLDSIIGDSAMIESADLRVDTLSKQNGFVLSPIMRERIQIDKPVPVA